VSRKKSTPEIETRLLIVRIDSAVVGSAVEL